MQPAQGDSSSSSTPKAASLEASSLPVKTNGPERPGAASAPRAQRPTLSPPQAASSSAQTLDSASNPLPGSAPRPAHTVSGKLQQLSSSLLSIKLADKLKLRRRSANLDDTALVPATVSGNLSPSFAGPGTSTAPQLPGRNPSGHMQPLSGGDNVSRQGSDIEEFDPPLHVSGCGQ